jgi:ATP-dependent RNA helicase DHX57
VRIAKLLLLATTFRCIRPVLDIAACLSHRTPFAAPFDLMHELNAARDSFAIPAGISST